MKRTLTRIFRSSALVAAVFMIRGVQAQNACNPGRIYDQIQSSFHTTIATRPNGTFTIWGEYAMADGANNRLTPADITPANGYAYTGTALHASLGSNSANSVQMFLMSTDGLYAWGTTNRVVRTAMKGTAAFGSVPMPTGVLPANIKQMSATDNALALVTHTGEVWVAGVNAAAHGNGGTLPGAPYWAQVTTTAPGNPALTGVTELRITPKGAFATTASGTWYTWGQGVYIGDGTAAATQTRAIPMTAPFPGTPLVIAATAGSGNGGRVSYFAVNPADHKIYALGDNEDGQLGQDNTTEQRGWVTVKASPGVDLTDVILIAANDQDGSGFAAVGAITSTERLFLWGSNDYGMTGGASANYYLPNSPNGFTYGTDVPLYVEVGGHTSAYLKECADRYCYLGHKIRGSMGDGVNAGSEIRSFDCVSTPQALICGASSFDGGDVPASFENNQAAAHYYRCPPGILLGAIGPQSNNGAPANVAPGADNMGSNGDGLEEDGITSLATYTGSGSYSVTVNGINTSGSVGYIYIWIDWNGNGIFEPSEYQTTSIPSTAGTQTRTFNWTGIPPLTCGKKYLRVRITNDVFTDNVATAIDERSIGASVGGEVEDYFVQATVPTSAGPDQHLVCNTQAGCGTVLAGIGLGVWTSAPGNPGTVNIATPSANNSGISNFSAPGAYRMIWTSGTCIDTMVITFNVKPDAVNDIVTTPENTPIVINLPGNDTDFDNNLNVGSVTLLTTTAHGTVSLNSITGQVTYTPNHGYNGTDSFIYRICDTGMPVLCDTATVTITVSAVNDPPVAVDDVNTTPEDTPVSGNVSTNDSDPDGPGATYTLVNGPGNGSLVLNTNGTYTYTPNANYNGTEVFRYRVCDGGTPNLCDTATVTITVTPVNDPPIANPDAVTTPEDTPIGIPVLANDTDIDGMVDPNTLTVLTSPANGTVSVNGVTGIVTYTPNPNFSGTDTFIYRVCDNGTPLPALCDTATVTVTVTPVNDPPVAVNDVNTTPEDMPVSGNVSTNDSDPDGPGATYAVVNGPTNGSLVLNTDGTYTYTPNANYNGTDVFRYRVCDGGTPNLCDTALVTITVTPVNDPPIANPDYATTNEDTPVTIPVLLNDSDIDGSLVTGSVAIGTQPANGTVTVNAVTGAIIYTPNPNFHGTDTFIYQVCDNGTPLPALCDTAIVTVTVLPVNDAPIANPDVAITPEDTPVVINVPANDTDVDGNLDPTTVTVTTGPSHGTVTVDPVTGAVTYTPDPDYNGTDNFNYSICDTGVPVYCSTTTVTVNVTPVNDPPIATDDAAGGVQGNPVVINVTANDSDPDGFVVPNTVVIVTPPTNGTAVPNGDGTITYTSTNNATGPITFTYAVCDNGNPAPSLCDTATVTVTLAPRTITASATSLCNQDAPYVSYSVTPDNFTTSNQVSIQWFDSNGNPVGTLTGLPLSGQVLWPGAAVNGFGAGTDWPGWVYSGGNWAPGADGFENTVPQVTMVISLNPTDTLTVNYPTSSPSCYTAPSFPPVAVNDSATTPEDTPVVINIPGNDYDPDPMGHVVPGSVIITTQPAHGTITVNPLTGAITYTPNLNYNGIDSLQYVIFDNRDSSSNIATVYVTITPVNDPPVAVKDGNTTPEDTPVSGDVSTNDSDPDGPGATYTVSSGPANGTLVLNPDGTYTYTPDSNYTGTDVFVYRVCDGGTPNLCDSATVTITVTPVNDPPIANPDNVSTPEDTPVAINVLANDSDVDGQLVPGSVVIGTQPAHGTVTVNGVTGVITYTPNPNFSGTDTFIYQVCDNGTPLPSLCDTAIVTVTVTPVNDPPVAVNDVNTTTEDTPVSGNVSTNDSDPDGPGATYTVVNNPPNGTLVLNTDGTYTYTPDSNYYGTDVFTYSVCDGGTPNLCDTATVTVTVTPVNDPPIAVDDFATTPEDVPVPIFVLGNDSDVDGSLVPNSVAVVTPPANGTVSVNPATGVITYTPNLDYNGTDSFSYIVCDNGTPLPALCDTAVVTITITPVNDPVVVTITPVVTDEDTPTGTVCFPINDDPGDTHTANLCGATHGTATVSVNNGTNQLCITFTPDADYYGPATVCVEICDNGTPTICDTISIPVTVLPINDPPIANPDNVTTPEDTPVAINVMGNDSDIDGALVPNTVAIGTPPANGTVTVNAVTGVITYTPNPNFSGTDTFIYQVCDNGTPLPSLCDTAIVTVTVTPVNDPPVAVNDVNTTTEDTPVSGNVSTNDSDPDGPGATYTVVNNPPNGTLVLNTDGTYTYTPDSNYYGTDVFTYSVCDGGTPNLCDTATVTVTVTPVNDPPLVNADFATTNEDTPVTINVLGNDTDVDGIIVPNTVATVTLPANGTVSINALTGVVTYTPNPNFNGTDSFIYIACDNGTPLPSQCDTAVVTITVNPVNDPPVANPDVATTPEDTPVTINVTGNDTDVDGNLDPTTVAVTSGPANGTVTVDPVTGAVTYTPNADYNGTDVFTYRVCDTGTPVYCDSTTVTITITPVNDPPVIDLPDTNTPEDTPVTICSPITDPDAGNVFTTTICGGPLHGTVTNRIFNGQVCVTYTPGLNYYGSDSICVIVCDNFGACDTSTTVITVTPVNDPPVAENDVNSTPEDTPVSGNVSTNDSDPDGPGATYTVVNGPTNGGLVLNTDGTYTYTPNANYNGTDVFTYSLCDGGTPNLCDTATVTITITPVNDPPVIDLPDTNTPEDTPVTVCSPITDPDAGNVFTATLCGGPQHGTVSARVHNGQVCVTYMPNPNYNGLDSVCVIVCDNFGACDTSTTVITVTPVNDPPVANPDVTTTPEDIPVTINVTGNDTDVDGNLDPTTVTVTSGPANGTVTVDPVTGAVTYTPNADYNGTDVFTYRVCDTGTPVYCDSTTVTITITPVNDPPVIDLPDTNTPEETPVTICSPITDPDTGNMFAASLCGGPQHGVVTTRVFNGHVCVTYTPSPNYNGLDSICVVVCDNFGACDTSTTVITVTPVNDPPVANPDVATTPEDIPVTINVTGNDTDVDGNLDPTTVTVTSGPTSGTVTVDPVTGAVTYTPNVDYNGTDVFTYRVCDTGTPVYCDSTTVTITITPVNDPPVIDLPDTNTPEETPVTICSPITDPDAGNVFTATLCGGPLHGTVSTRTHNGQVCVTYTPSPNYNGLDSICVIVCDNFGACDTSTTVITVTPVNDPPVANPDVTTTPEDTPVTVNVTSNDTDVDGNLDPTTVTVTSGPTSGTVTVDPVTGAVTYTPNADYNGTDVFTYRVCDTGTPVYCDSTTVTITITPVNDPPVIDLPDTNTPEETPVTICSPIADPDAGNVFSAALCGGPYHGTVSGPTIFNGQVCVTYTPGLNYYGSDSICVIVCDNFGACDTSTTVITVTPVNDPPVAVDDNATTTTGTPVTVDVKNNDTDIDGNIDPTTVTVITPPTQGTVTVDPVTGIVTYTPGATACGTDTFVYQVCDDGTPLPALCDQATVTITITDTQAPVIAGCPGNITLTNDTGVCGAVATWTLPTATDNCAGMTLTSNYSSGAVFPIGVTTVTYVARDAAGNADTCSFTVTVTDTEAPVFTNCPGDITVSNFFNTCYEQVHWTALRVTDNCGAGNVTVTSSHESGHVFAVGTTTVTHVATDSYGNSTTCTFNVTVQDTQAPTLQNCPVDMTVDNTPGICGAAVRWVAPAYFDNCPGAVLTATHNSGDVFPVGTTTVTYTLTDAAGLTASCSFNVTVRDAEAPTITGCPTNLTVATDAGTCGAVVTWTAPVITDNCPGLTVTSTHTPGTVFPLGTTRVTYTATDSVGHVSTCSFSVTVNDTGAPVITGCPTNIAVNNTTGVCGANVTWTAPTATDNCTLASFTSTHAPGTVFPIGTTTVTYTATDAAGNVSTCTFTVTVTDAEAPVVSNCPTNITVDNAYNTCGASVSWNGPVFTDNCPGLTVTSTHTPGTVFPVGATTVTYTATDAAGHVTTCTFDVTVNDTQAPRISGCPINITQPNTPGSCGRAITWIAPTVFDNCPGVTFTATHAPGDTFAVGTTTVIYTATDAAGNTAVCSFTVTITDSEKPVFAACPAPITVSTDAGVCSAAVTWTVPTATDNCAAPVITSTHNPGDVFPLGTSTVVYTATDAAGNSSTCSFTVTVNDTEAPVIAACPTNITVNNTTGVCGATVTWTAPTATDNCTLASFTGSHASGTVFPVGTTTVTYTAVDAAGNRSTCSFSVTVNDTEAPTVTACPTNVTLNAAFNTCGAPVLWTAPVFTDNCAGMTVSTSHLPGTTFPIGTTTVTYTATDASGNTNSCSFTVTVNDVQAPVISSCPIDAKIPNNPGICGATYNWVLPTAFDNCPGTVLTTTHAPGSVFPVGTTRVTYTATDASGNTATCSFNVTVNDVEAPVIAACPADRTVSNDAGTCGAAVTWTAPAASDNCGVATFVSSHNPGDVFPVGVTTVTYTATDTTGNVSTCSFNVTVNDTELPVITGCPADINTPNTTGVCQAAVTWTAPTATDNCATGFTFTSTHNPGDVFPVGTTRVTYTATDGAGNVSLCSFDVTVEDTELPIITGCPAAINSCTDTITWTAPTASDNCGIVSFTASHNPGDIFPVGRTQVTYTATDAAGNVSVCSFYVTVSKPVLTMIHTDVTCHGLNNGTATAIVNNAVAPFSFNWGAAGTDSLLTGLTPGVYNLTVTDAIGCTATGSISISEPEVFAVLLGAMEPATCGFSDGNAIVLTSGGTKPYAYQWTNGQTTETLYNVADGVYGLLATDAKGCTDSLTVTVTCEFGKVPQLLTPNGDGHNDTWVIPGIDKYPDAVVEVYNRWGNLVYKATPYLNDWAGISTGMLNVGKDKLPAGTYFYVIVLKKGEKAMTGYLELQY